VSYHVVPFRAAVTDFHRINYRPSSFASADKIIRSRSRAHVTRSILLTMDPVPKGIRCAPLPFDESRRRFDVRRSPSCLKRNNVVTLAASSSASAESDLTSLLAVVYSRIARAIRSNQLCVFLRSVSPLLRCSSMLR